MREPSRTTHVVKPHDRLSAIALRYYGDIRAVPLLIARNRLPKNGLIPVGARLALPKPHPHLFHAYPARPATPPHPGHLRVGGHDATYDLVTRPDAGAMLPALPVAIKIPLEGERVIQDTGEARIESKLTGEIIITEIKDTPISVEIKGLEIGKISIEQKVTVQEGYQKATFSNQIDFDRKKGTVSLNFGFTRSTTVNGQEFLNSKLEFDPILRAWKCAIESKEIEGEFRDLTFKGHVALEVSVTLRDPDEPPEPVYALSPKQAVAGLLLVVGLSVGVTEIGAAIGGAVEGTAALVEWVEATEVFGGLGGTGARLLPAYAP